MIILMKFSTLFFFLIAGPPFLRPANTNKAQKVNCFRYKLQNLEVRSKIIYKAMLCNQTGAVSVRDNINST